MQVNFGVADPADVQFGDPIIYIILTEAYKQLWDEAGNSSVSDRLAILEDLLADRPDLANAQLPVLPFEAYQVMGAGTLFFAADGLRSRLGASAEVAQGPFDGRVSFDLGRGGEYRSGSGAKVPANHEHVGASLSVDGVPMGKVPARVRLPLGVHAFEIAGPDGAVLLETSRDFGAADGEETQLLQLLQLVP